jgi:hypothetical protein
VTKQAALDEAQRYVARVVDTQQRLGYSKPPRAAVKTAVGQAATAVATLSRLAKPS